MPRRTLNAYIGLLCLNFMDIQAKDLNLIPAQQFDSMLCVDKLYVAPSQIYFSNYQIFIRKLEGFVQIDSLYTDSQGIYYLGKKIPGYPDHWKCPKCGTMNDYKEYCEVCCYWPSGDIEEPELIIINKT